jgi:hypothetical protein
MRSVAMGGGQHGSSDFINGLFFLYLIGIAVAFFIYRATQTVRKK